MLKLGPQVLGPDLWCAVHDLAGQGLRDTNDVIMLCRVRLYNMKKLKPLAVLKHHKGSVNTVAFSCDNATLASGSSDSTIALWSVYPPK